MDFIKVQKGADGEASYVWIRYSAVENPSASDMVTTPSDYIGIYTGPSSTAPQDPNDYEWYKIKGDSIAGPPGEDGKPTYIHIKYSNDGGDTFTDGNGTTPGEYMGVLVDFNEEASDTPSDYVWQFVKGDPGTGYTVYLSNENHSFSADGDGIVQASSIEFKVCAWKDTELIAAMVTLPENVPTGMTVGIRENTNGTLAPIITVAVDETFKTTEGTLEFTVACGDIEVTKIFSYNVIRGGKDGDGVEWSAVTYQVGDTGTTPPTGEWLEEIPEVPTGKYLWTRTIMHYKNGSDLASYSVSYQGTDGKDGTDGTNGRGIKSVTNYYLAYNSPAGVTTETEGWTTEMQVVSEEKRYLWNYEETTYTDDSPATITEPAMIGMYSTNGENGRGIASITEYYLISELATGVTVDTPGWTEEVQETTSEKIYLWNYEKITYTDDSEPTVTTPCVIGTKGDPGVGVKSTEITYQIGESGTEIPTGEWTSEIPETTSGQFLWVRTITTYTDDSTSIAYSVSKNGEDGSARQYGIETSSSFILANLGHTAFNPATVTFTPYYQDGEDGVHNGFTCDIELKYSGDGENWESLGRATNVSARTLNTSELWKLNAFTRHVKCLVYSNGAESPFIETILLVRDSTFETEVLFVKENNEIFMDGNHLVAYSVSANKITANNIVGDNGWINLHEGKFDYGNGKLSWNGTELIVSGHIIATSGQIAGFTITDESLYTRNKSKFDNTSTGVYIGTNGISLGDGFSVDEYGNLTALSGRIANFTIAENSLYSNSKSAFSDTSVGVYLGDDGISLGDSFSVDANGSMVCSEGYIGGWLINTNGLSYTQTIDGAWTTNGNEDTSGYTKLGTYIYPGKLNMEDTDNGQRVAGGTIIWSHVIPYTSDGQEYQLDGKGARTGFILEADGSFAFGAYHQEMGWIKFHPRAYNREAAGSLVAHCENVEFVVERILMTPGGYKDASVADAEFIPGKPTGRCALLIESTGRIVYDETLSSGYIRGLKDKIDTIDAKLSSITGEGASGNSFKITANTITLTANDALYLKPGGTAPSSERVLFIGANGKITYASNIGTDEIGKLYNIRENIQTQLDNTKPYALYWKDDTKNPPTFTEKFYVYKGTSGYGFCPLEEETEMHVLGTPTRRWKELHVLNGYVSGNMTVSGYFVGGITVGPGGNTKANINVPNGDIYVNGTGIASKINDLEEEISNLDIGGNTKVEDLYFGSTQVARTYYDSSTGNYGIIPIVTEKYVLGTPTQRWNRIFTQEARVYGAITANGTFTMDGTFVLNDIDVGAQLNDMLTKDTADDLYAAKGDYLTRTTANGLYATKNHGHTDLSNRIDDLEDEIDSIGSGGSSKPTSLYYTNGTEVVETYRDKKTLNYGLIPIQSAQSVLGIPSKRWNKLFLTSSSSIDSSSDQRLKTMISDIDERYEKTFMGLRPVTYTWKNTEVDSKIHCGFIAQQVNEMAQKNNLTMDSFAFLNHYYFDEEVDGLRDQWSLAYSELHGLEVHMIQKAIHRIESLEEENASLKEQIQSIQEQLNSLLSN